MNIFAPVLLSVALTGQLRNNAATETPPVIQPDFTEHGQMAHAGFGLVGSKGRIYIFGNTGFADCMQGGEQHIVALKKEDDKSVPDPDKYMYYYEIATRNRWSISTDDERGQYAIYFQPANDRVTAQGKPKWQFFQNAKFVEDTRSKRYRSSIPSEGNAAADGFVPRSSLLLPPIDDPNRPAVGAGFPIGEARVLYQPPAEPIITRYVQPQVVQPQRCCGN